MTYSSQATGGQGPYFELRLYEMVQTRTAGMTAFMRDDVPPLFKRHGVPVPLTMWEGYAGPFSSLYGYLIKWDNLDQRMTCWGHFYSDPDFGEAHARNFAGEQRVERANISFMCASPVWDRFRTQGSDYCPGDYELRLYDASIGTLADSRTRVADELAHDAADGRTILGVFETIIGGRSPQIVALLTLPTEREGGEAAGATQGRGQGEGIGYDVFWVKPTSYGVARENLASHPEG